MKGFLIFALLIGFNASGGCALHFQYRKAC